MTTTAETKLVLCAACGHPESDHSGLEGVCMACMFRKHGGWGCFRFCPPR